MAGEDSFPRRSIVRLYVGDELLFDEIKKTFASPHLTDAHFALMRLSSESKDDLRTNSAGGFVAKVVCA
jgi:hypothetical protein